MNLKELELLDTRSKRVYNNMQICGDDDRMNHDKENRSDSNIIDMTPRLSRDEAIKLLGQHKSYIKETIHSKLETYFPITFREAFNGFRKWLKDKEYRPLRVIPEADNPESFLESLIKDFLVELTYYTLEESYIKRYVMKKTGINNVNSIDFSETYEFIIERLEQDQLKKLKSFREKSTFKTYLTTAVTRLLFDFWRLKQRKGNYADKYEADFNEIYEAHQPDPFETFVKMADEAEQQKAAELLPTVMARLNRDERLAMDLKYENDASVSKIERLLGMTRFKTEKFIKRTENKIAKELSELLANKRKRGGET